jgi:hypothetical protein
MMQNIKNYFYLCGKISGRVSALLAEAVGTHFAKKTEITH